MNEELQTINAELHSKLDDLALAQSDMQNLLNSTDIATLFLDNAFYVRRFTEHITRIIHLREADIGRPLSDLASTTRRPHSGSCTSLHPRRRLHRRRWPCCKNCRCTRWSWSSKTKNCADPV
jgi:hypothetical protein